jgi:hypothetical protein
VAAAAVTMLLEAALAPVVATLKWGLISTTVM